MNNQAESVTPAAPAQPSAQTQPVVPPAPAATDPKADDKPQIEVKDGTAKELSERLKLRREVEQLRKESADYKAKYEKLAPWEDRLAKAKERPLAFAKEAGLTWDDLAQDAMRGDASEPAAPTALEKEAAELRKELTDLKAWREAQEKERESSAEAQRQQAFSAYENKLRELAGAPDKYVHALAMEDSVDELVATATAVRNQHWNNTTVRDAQGRITKRGELLNEEQALQKVEDYWRTKLSRAPGAKPAAQPAAQVSHKQSAQPAQSQEKPKPITNQLTPPPTVPEGERPKLSRQEQLEASVAKLKAQRAAQRQAAQTQ